MEELKKIIVVLEKFGPKKLPLFGYEEVKRNNLEQQLYQNVKAGKYQTEEEALCDLYANKEDYFKYRMLKSRLKKKLYNHLYFIENELIFSNKNEKSCLDLLHKGNMLRITGDRDFASIFYKRALKISIPFEFTEITVSAFYHLLIIYSEKNEKKKFNNTLEKIKSYQNLKIKEGQANLLYNEAKMKLKGSTWERSKYINQIPYFLDQLNFLWAETNSFNIFINYYYLKKWYLEQIGNFEEYLKNIEYFLFLFEKNKINSLRFNIGANHFSHIYGLLKVKKYQKGLNLAPQYLKIFNPYSHNWFAFMEHYILLAFHDQKYNLAHDILKGVFKNDYFSRIPAKLKEVWTICKAYLYFLLPNQYLTQSFNYQQFIASVPISSKDKLGHNISVLVVQFLFLLKNKDYELLSSREDALRKYAGSYLKDPYSKRSLYFFKMLLVVIRTDFNKEKSKVKGVPWLEKLKNTPVPGDAYAAVEIIPYEKLWEIVLDIWKSRGTSEISWFPIVFVWSGLRSSTMLNTPSIVH